MATPFETFVNTELPKRIGTNESPITPEAGDIPVFTGVGLLTEAKTAADAGLATASDLSNKQETLVSGTNIKTINGSTLLGSGDLTITTSTNLTTSQTATEVTVLSDTGTDAIIALGNGTNAGVSLNNYTSAEKSKLAAITGTNTGDETQASIQTKLGVANTNTDGYLTSTDWNTFNNKQAALANVITANTYGSSTQYPVITFNAKGIATGVTLQTVPTPTFTDATFSVQKNGSPSIAASWSLSALTASRVHTYPDKAIDFKTLSSIGASDGNVLSGTRTRIVGGISNTVDGTDVVAVGCNGCNLSAYTSSVTAIGLQSTANFYSVAPRQAILLGSSALAPQAFNISGAHAAALGVIQCVYSDVCTANGATFNATLDGSNTPSSTNCIKLLPSASVLSSAVIDLDFIIVVGDNMSGALLAPRRTVFAKRRVYIVFAFNASDVATFNSSVEVIGTDTSVGSAATGTVTVGVTVDSANNRLIPTVSATSGSKQTLFQFGVRSTAHYNRNV